MGGQRSALRNAWRPFWGRNGITGSHRGRWRSGVSIPGACMETEGIGPPRGETGAYTYGVAELFAELLSLTDGECQEDVWWRAEGRELRAESGDTRGEHAKLGMSSGRRGLGQFEQGDLGWGVEADGGEGGADASADVEVAGIDSIQPLRVGGPDVGHAEIAAGQA
jgi:hypothetical protein